MPAELDVKWLGRVEYQAALEIQNKIVEAVIAGDSPQTLLLLEHEPVFTIGRTRDVSSLRDPHHLPHPVVETNRGGQATYHGPGQLVGYPILDLNRNGRDLHRYLRFLEEALISVCGEFGVAASSRESLTGVWVEERKIASLGVGVRRWVTMHGFALNVTRTSCEGFLHITPCGITGVEMTSLEREASKSITVEETAELAAQALAAPLEARS